MNSLSVHNAKTKFSTEEHLVLFVDHVPLDEYLQNHYPDEDFNGLVPALLDWVEDDVIRTIIWNRILPSEGQTTKAPILLCPEDMNFSCDVIVVEVKRRNGLICWSRFGKDNTLNVSRFPDKLGNTVVWLEKIEPLTFSSIEYSNCIEAFHKETQARK